MVPAHPSESRPKKRPETRAVKEELSPFKPEDYLTDDVALAHYLTLALNDPDDSLADALQVAARARGIDNLSEASGLTAEKLASPDIDTIRLAFKVLNLRLEIVPVGDSRE